ncbi:hypothetical protein JCM9140_639 [Halalkalibacter wakoensis JCM 9140]|uniref:Uncharacterized protein n=1 Tax=Halalkalibacter wakoensis JCM 9140 TaxID=1236970 RepID=W4PXV9_9BACI|nr:hypothetical protein [Halalkalibacter wakoensis]GAE24691.1 hypothetical protein JCM9140_639 [Halalkalibacter wakoensis JCM 9140]
MFKKKQNRSKSQLMVSSMIGGALGAAGVLYMNSERGKELKQNLEKTLHGSEGAISDSLLELAKEWANFGDVVNTTSQTQKD